MSLTEQERFWSGDFGKEYNKRTLRDLGKVDQWFFDSFGTKRSELNTEFLGGLELNSILECGCGTGNQLLLLKNQGYENLSGVDIQEDALKSARQRLPDANLVQSSLFDIPFDDDFFDLTCTNTVLIHIAVCDLIKVMSEIVRVSKRYIWGFEFYNDTTVEMDYRGHKNKNWKGDYCQIYLDNFNLKLVRRKKLKYLAKPDILDEIFLLEKE